MLTAMMFWEVCQGAKLPEVEPRAKRNSKLGANRGNVIFGKSFNPRTLL
jgi:hypothetical protein